MLIYTLTFPNYSKFLDDEVSTQVALDIVHDSVRIAHGIRIRTYSARLLLKAQSWILLIRKPPIP